MRLDVVRIDDPAYDTPLLVGTTAGELTSEECWVGYGHRWPVETNFLWHKTPPPWRCRGHGRKRRWSGGSVWPC